MDYGFGAVFGCPAHDQRDLDFAKKYNLKVIPVIKPSDASNDFQINFEAYTGNGVLFNSKFFCLRLETTSVVFFNDILFSFLI